MLKRKAVAAIITFMTFVAVMTMLIWRANLNDFHEIWLGIVVVTIAGAPLILIYGLLVSLLSDALFQKLSGIKRVILAGITHLTFAGLFFFGFSLLFDRDVNVFYEFNSFWAIYNWVVVASIVCGMMFFIVDELLRMKMKVKSRQMVNI